MPLFALGDVTMTEGARQALYGARESCWDLVARHERADWGEIASAERRANSMSLAHEGRPTLLSVYRTSGDAWIAVLTEPCQEEAATAPGTGVKTTIMLREEYYTPDRNPLPEREEARRERIQQYGFQIQRLCSENKIAVTYKDGAAAADKKNRRIYVSRIESAFQYAIVLHEIGHIVGPMRSGRKLEQEVGAWLWAKENAREWTTEMDWAMHIGLASYLQGAQRDRRMWMPPKDHIAHLLARTPPIHFDPGEVRATPAAMNALASLGTPLGVFLDRHTHGDRGEANHFQQFDTAMAYLASGIVFSSYKINGGNDLFIFTAKNANVSDCADVSFTTVVLSAEIADNWEDKAIPLCEEDFTQIGGVTCGA